MFQGVFWVANNFSEKVAIVQNFLQDGPKIMVVIDNSAQSDIVGCLEFIRSKNLLSCDVNISTKPHTTLFKSNKQNVETKTIYIYPTFDAHTIKILNTMRPILSIFHTV